MINSLPEETTHSMYVKGKFCYERNFSRLRLSSVLEFWGYCATPTNFRISFKFYRLRWQSKHSKPSLQHVKLFMLVCFVANWRWPYTSRNWTCRTAQCRGVGLREVSSEVNFRLRFAVVKPTRSQSGWFPSLLPLRSQQLLLSLCRIWGVSGFRALVPVNLTDGQLPRLQHYTRGGDGHPQQTAGGEGHTLCADSNFNSPMMQSDFLITQFQN